MKVASIFAVATVAVFAATTALAGDGRTGPTPFTGADLDAALSDLNDFVQARYTIENAMSLIDHANIVAPQVIVDAEGATVDFGPAIADGTGLDVNLAQLRQDMSRPSIVVLIQNRMAAPNSIGNDFGPEISGDVGLQANLAALHRDMADKLPVFEMIAALGRVDGEEGDFGPYVSGDMGLDRHLASLNVGAGAHVSDFGLIVGNAGTVKPQGRFGPAISGDETLDVNLVALANTIAETTSEVPYITGASFDFYVATLALY